MITRILPLCFALAACESPCAPPMPPPVVDMAPVLDATIRPPRDFATGGPDLAGSDMALTCIKCNAVINPCPAKGLYCDGKTGCCDTNPH